MVIAVIAGILIGVLGAVPLFVASKKVRKISATSSMDMLAPFLITMAISFIVLICGMIVCRVAFPEMAKFFTIAEFAAFVISVFLFGISVSKRM
ncbi:MAG: hypothetical protein Q4D06_03900 [Coriobacteriia bacterium]|nr:hypothetical protein [Coriobacteriia bacterium]